MAVSPFQRCPSQTELRTPGLPQPSHHSKHFSRFWWMRAEVVFFPPQALQTHPFTGLTESWTWGGGGSGVGGTGILAVLNWKPGWILDNYRFQCYYLQLFCVCLRWFPVLTDQLTRPKGTELHSALGKSKRYKYIKRPVIKSSLRQIVPLKSKAGSMLSAACSLSDVSTTKDHLPSSMFLFTLCILGCEIPPGFILTFKKKNEQELRFLLVAELLVGSVVMIFVMGGIVKTHLRLRGWMCIIFFVALEGGQECFLCWD